MTETDRRDLTAGGVGKKLVLFSLPILVTMLLQAVYNIVDMILVGRFLGAPGMSAVSVGGQVTLLVLCIVNGLSNGGAVCVGRLFGRRQLEKAHRLIGAFLSFLILLALAITAVMIVFRQPLLEGLDTPAESFQGAVDYLTVCMLGTVFVYVYNACYAVLRGIGESVRPMLIVLFTTVENVALDLLFLGVIPLGTGGAALATVLSQFTSMCLIIAYVRRRTGLFDFRPASFRLRGGSLGTVLKVGLPQACQFFLTNLSFLLIIALINGYGVDASAAAGAANKLLTFGILPGQALMSGIITLTAQNLPGKGYRRIIKGLFCGIGVSMACTAVVFLLCELSPALLYSIFTSDPGVAEVGVTYLRLLALCLLVENTMFCIFGVLTGAGYTLVTMACALISAFGVRYALAYVLSAFTPLGFNGIALAYSAAPLVGIIVGGGFLLSGRWKVSRLERRDTEQ